MSFQIRLDSQFIRALNDLRDTGSWWDALRKDQERDVFIAIREQGINAYVGGRSIARIDWKGGRLKLLVHPKFLAVTRTAARVNLLPPNRSPVQGVIIDDASKYAENFDLVKTTARLFSDEERDAENGIAVKCGNVIDMEVAFSGEPDDDGEAPKSRTGRVDLVSADKDGNLTLVEAKLYSNAELHCVGVPRLCEQLGKYQAWATRNKGSIINAYQAVREYREQLGLTVGKLPVTISNLDTSPRLLILGYARRDVVELGDIRDAILKALSQQTPPVNAKVACIGNASSVRSRHLQN